MLKNLQFMCVLFGEPLSLPRTCKNNGNPRGKTGRRFRYINTRTVGKKSVRKKWIYESTCSNLKEHRWGYMTYIQPSFEIISFSFLYSASQMFWKELSLPHEATDHTLVPKRDLEKIAISSDRKTFQPWMTSEDLAKLLNSGKVVYWFSSD